jgi:hypothetical protein
MAQTKSRSAGGSSSRSGSSTGNSSGSKSRASGNRSAARRGSSNGRGRVSSAKRAATGAVQSTKDTVAGGAKTAGDALGGAAQKAKGPALTGGAALVGLAGGLAIAGRGGRRRVLGMPVPGSRRPLVKLTVPRRKTKVRGKDLIKAAGEVGTAGRQFGELAGEVRLVRQRLDSRPRRSPVEVVLEGLTARRPQR